MQPVTLARCVIFAIALGFAAAFAATAPAGPFEDGLAAYERGDYATAHRLWRPLAEQGDADAQARLGVMYEWGRGVPQDNAEAANWYRRAGEQGNEDTQALLGFMYAEGHGVPQDYAKAARWYLKAAEQGDVRAQAALGLMYKKGQGVLQDYVQAHMWFNMAALKARKAFREPLRFMRDDLATHMTPDQIAEAQRLAREWRPK